MRSGAQRFYEGLIGFSFPLTFSGIADVREWYDDDAQCFRISVNVHNRVWGPLFGYTGSFDVEWPSVAAGTVPRSRHAPAPGTPRVDPAIINRRCRAGSAKGRVNMYGLIGKLSAVAGQRDALVSILLDSTGEMPGCVSYVIATDPADADGIWITEVWDNPASHKASLNRSRPRSRKRAR